MDLSTLTVRVGPKGGRLAITVDETCLVPGVGFTPRLVEENQPGYWPGDLVRDAGDTLPEARAWRDTLNACLGLDRATALHIEISSFVEERA